jgi:hypothetical protein
MGKILNFIIIDEFRTKRLGSVYFLTHWHSGNLYSIAIKLIFRPLLRNLQ